LNFIFINCFNVKETGNERIKDVKMDGEIIRNKEGTGKVQSVTLGKKTVVMVEDKK
jgi:hypothetical protein